MGQITAGSMSSAKSTGIKVPSKIARPPGPGAPKTNPVTGMDVCMFILVLNYLIGQIKEAVSLGKLTKLVLHSSGFTLNSSLFVSAFLRCIEPRQMTSSVAFLFFFYLNTHHLREEIVKAQ